jgi:histidinol phosphatase-like enzyme
LPDLQNAAANKYNFPSYRQHNLGLKYIPKKVKNLDVHLILVVKEPLTNQKLLPTQQYNKVDLLHFNGLINWKLAKD